MGEMLLPISSNWANGMYTCLELLVVTLFSRCLGTLIGCWNVKRIYSDEKVLELKGSPFTHFADFGLTSRRVQVAGLLSFSVVLVLMTAGGYSILGITENVYDEVKVDNLVRLARPGEHLNFTENISLENQLVSGNIILLRDYADCFTISLTVGMIYEYTNSMKDLSVPRWSAFHKLYNSTCLTDEQYFKESILFRHETSDLPEGYKHDCKWSVNVSTVPEGEMHRSPVIQPQSCRYPVVEAWCLRNDVMNCAAISRLGDRFSLSIIPEQTLHSSIQVPRISVTYQQLVPPETWGLQDIVRLMSVGVLDPTELDLLTRFTVETNATVLKKLGERDVTKVKVLLFVVTTGVACSITVITLVVAVYVYLRVVVFPGRKLCNRFNTAVDLINYAAALDPAGRYFSTTERSRAVSIGKRTSKVDVGPLIQVDENQNVIQCE